MLIMMMLIVNAPETAIKTADFVAFALLVIVALVTIFKINPSIS